jgi:aminopeptidase YwaD
MIRPTPSWLLTFFFVYLSGGLHQILFIYSIKISIGMKQFFILLVLLFGNLFSASAQDSMYARRIVDTLTSRYFLGRGYVNNGMQKAAAFLSEEMKQIGLQPLDGKNFLQNFAYNANSFPGKMRVAINGIELVPGKDFLVGAESRGLQGAFGVAQSDSVTFVNPPNRCIVKLADKLTWEASQTQADYTVIVLLKGRIKALIETVEVDIENKFINKFKTANVCGLVPGTKFADSIIFFTAHYDHLGAMGSSTYFPGANDNASGQAVLLSLAKYFIAHPQPYSIGFICFAGEEAGLVGSQYYVNNPIKPLSNIKFLVNLDLLGTGEEGITVVNSTEFPKAFQKLNDLNAGKKYLAAINPRGKAANSDHYFFTEKGVPSFFIYTLGGIKAYHDIYDIATTLPLTEYNDVMQLLIGFVEK